MEQSGGRRSSPGSAFRLMMAHRTNAMTFTQGQLRRLMMLSPGGGASLANAAFLA